MSARVRGMSLSLILVTITLQGYAGMRSDWALR